MLPLFTTVAAPNRYAPSRPPVITPAVPVFESSPPPFSTAPESPGPEIVPVLATVPAPMRYTPYLVPEMPPEFSTRPVANSTPTAVGVIVVVPVTAPAANTVPALVSVPAWLL